VFSRETITSTVSKFSSMRPVLAAFLLVEQDETNTKNKATAAKRFNMNRFLKNKWM
jgi:hypothetical protein